MTFDTRRARVALDRKSAIAPTRRAGIRALSVDRDGMIEGYASLFDRVDMAKDAIEPGAFRASLARGGASGVRLLWQHDAKEPIGVWRSLVEDERGLRVLGELNLSAARARDAFALIRQGAVDGLSIGFKALRARSDQRSGVRRLMAIDLWEISIVTFPMLSEARVFAVERDASPFGGDLKKLAARRERAGLSFH